MDELNMLQLLMANVSNFQQFGTVFVSGGKPEYTSKDAEKAAKKSGFPMYGDCSAFGEAPRGGEPMRSGWMYEWVCGESVTDDE